MSEINNWLFGHREHRHDDCKEDLFDDTKFDCKEDCNKGWSALDPRGLHPLDDNGVVQQAEQVNKTIQESYEQIIIKDSADVEVTTTDTKVALSLQAAIQAAIVLVISISIADSTKAEEVTQELLNKSKTVQVNRQQTYIHNSRGVRVTTTDTDIAINIQLLIQILLALVVNLDIL
ncbi:spore coat protein [Sutcliffiella deserti]|uniref:spore coat protein n=1 Tax=Sutcliffiella deserti TaxID=2875501 RepID=UPI001CBE68FA|nr:spore coat protein [Sutcliffiella deserti]